jgi:thiol-disulfide isomerase/thioredoxin/uncharacterized membrane protein YphA (DoxX/SURF4 family)
MEIILLLFRLVLFAVFALAGIGKLLDLSGSEKAVKAFGTPPEFARFFAVAIPVAELIFAFCFLFPDTSWLGALGGLILLASFIGGMAWQMRQGNAPDCHCFGQIHSEPVGVKSLVRNIIFAALAIVLIFAGRANQGRPLGTTNREVGQNITLLLFALALVVVASYLKRLVDENKRLARRIELLELMDPGGKPVERSEASDPAESLPIGAPFPDFQLPDANGRIVTYEHVLAAGKPQMFFFVGPNCEPCKALLPDFEDWRKEFANSASLTFVSSGDVDANRGRFGDEIARTMLLQKNRELANVVLAKWTPSAIAVTRGGAIASHPAVGDMAIRDLMDRFRESDRNAETFHISNGSRPGRNKIGQTVPKFSLEDLHGNAITEEFFRGRTTLAIFLSTSCGFCKDVVAEVRETEKEDGAPQMIVFSEGEREEHLDWEIATPVILEKNYKTAEKIGMFSVPSAVLVNENGIVISEAAVGSQSIWALVGKYH